MNNKPISNIDLIEVNRLHDLCLRMVLSKNGGRLDALNDVLQHFDLEELVHASFRYYLGRRTISTCTFARNLAAALPHLSENTRVMIVRELAQAYAEAANNPDSKPLGDDCDREAWDAVRDAGSKSGKVRIHSANGEWEEAK